MIAVLDASVVVKWFFADSEHERDAERALEVLGAVRSGTLEPLQPPHWLAEVAAVVARLKPETAAPAIELLDAMEFAVSGEVAVYKRAAALAAELEHHLFDTLYHAVALENSATLISADRRYYRKARQLGHIAYLPDWDPGLSTNVET